MVSRKGILIVEDNDDQRSVLSAMASDWGYRVETATDGEEAISKLSTFPAHVVVTDLAMPRLDGIGLLRWLGEQGNAPPTIVMTAYGDISKAVSIVHDLGAFWFLEKPFDFDVMKVLLERASAQGSLAREKEVLQRRLAHTGVLAEMVGRSGPMQRMFSLIQQVAPTRAAVLITGESGTGKEMAANTIHRLSPRRDGPFVAINCAALPETLMESELFGHEKGSFTGASERRAGCFELAQGGTLLLDEIAEMQPATQAKLLRVLEDGKVRRLGAKSEMQVDVRVLAATNKVPEVAVAKGELRRDLYYRLNVFHLHLPPLRERKEDIPLICDLLLNDLNNKHARNVAGLEPAVMERFVQYDWPGNVRELRNVLERSVIMAAEGLITLSHLPSDFGYGPKSVARENGVDRPQRQEPRPVSLQTGITMAEAERYLILKTLEHTNNNKTRAADLLGISLKTLHNKLKGYAASQTA